MEYMYSHPTEVVIELTRDCNFNCPTCFNSFKREGDELSTEFVKQVIDSITKAKISRVRFSGGEPLLRDDLFELMKYAKTKDLNIWLNTNTTLVTESIARQLEKYVENILIPFNGYDKKSDFNWTQTKDGFEKKLQGVKFLKKSKIPMVRGGTVATTDNIENLEKIFDLVKDLDSWEVWRPISEENIDVKRLVDKLISLSTDWGKMIPIANAIPFCSYDMAKMNLIALGGCFDDGHSRIVVDPSGYAKPSYFIDKNIGDPGDIMSCWNHEYMLKMRNLEFLPDECHVCRYKQKCKGGSRYWKRDPLMSPEL